MHITYSPVRMDLNEQILIDVEGDKIFIEGEEYDFSPLPEGAILPQCAITSEWFLGDVTRVDGVIHVVIKLPFGANASHETRYPTPVVVGNGSVDVPEYNVEEVTPEQPPIPEEEIMND